MVSEKINGARNLSCASSPHINLNVMYGPFVDECEVLCRPPAVPQEGSSSQNSVFLHSLWCRVCEPQVCCMDAGAAV